MTLYIIINISYLIISWWILAKLKLKSFKGKEWSSAFLCLLIASVFLVFGMLTFDVPLMILDFHEPEVHEEMKEKWWVFPLGAFVFLAIAYPLETLLLMAGRRHRGENPDHSMSFEDLAIQSMERTSKLYSNGEISLYRLVVDIRSNYRLLSSETVSRDWKSQMRKSLDQLSKIDKVIFDSGSPEMPEHLNAKIVELVHIVENLISQARNSIEMRFNG